ncbi:SRPBCC family protein [Rhizohabitans arisaemae]|uniref:SRPBCC family protein n=1 Tax=Rhizohabitans arisaemae TaxID=2720610 RepID=UPI0024B1631E|nr:SRPBCC domain-containing protein [Rhizohabitans arisaemae]
MGHGFEVDMSAEVDATPEQVWEAISTGPGIDSWFMGRSEVEPKEGGTVRLTFGGYTPSATVTSWEPLKRFAYRSEEDGDGRFIAYDFLIEGRDGSTFLRTVTSGFLPGDDWEGEYESMKMGGEMYFRTLVEYVNRFPGRVSVPLTVFSAVPDGWDAVRPRIVRALGLAGTAAVGDPARVAVPGLPAAEGVVYVSNPQTLGVRTDDALYRFVGGFGGSLILMHELFGDADPVEAERSWRSWLETLAA